MVGGSFSLQQFGTTYQALGGLFPHFGFFGVRQTRSHGPGRHKHRGQVAKMQCTYQEPWHDFVAHPQHQGCVKHVVAERHRRGHRNCVTAEQAKLHARCTLGYAVTHGRYATGHLRGSPQAPRFLFDDIGVVLQGCVGRQHVVVAVDDGDIGRTLHHHLVPVQTTGLAGHAGFIAGRGSGNCVGHVGAAQALGPWRARSGSVQLRQIGRSCGLTALADALGHGLNAGMHWYGIHHGYKNLKNDVTKLHV